MWGFCQGRRALVFVRNSMPTVGLKLSTLRLRVACPTDGARWAPRKRAFAKEAYHQWSNVAKGEDEGKGPVPFMCLKLQICILTMAGPPP